MCNDEYTYEQLKEMIAAAKRAEPTEHELMMEYEYQPEEEDARSVD